MASSGLENLPITLSSAGIFDQDEIHQAPLCVKLEAWFNFQALKLNWYSDESNIQTFSFKFIADTKIDDLYVDNAEWLVNRYGNTQVLCKQADKHTESILVLTADDLKQLMNGQLPVESFFRTLVMTAINEYAQTKGLSLMTSPEVSH